MPEPLAYGWVAGLFLLPHGLPDGADVDTEPDKVPAQGGVTLVRLQTETVEAPGPEFAAIPRDRTRCTLDPDGRLLGPSGALMARMVPGVYWVTYELISASIKPHQIVVTAAHTQTAPLELPLHMPPGGDVLAVSEYAALSSRIDGISAPDLSGYLTVAAANSTYALKGEGGGGAEPVQIGTLTLPGSPATGQSVTVLADPATVIPSSGIVWDTGGKPTVAASTRLLISFVWSGTDWVGTYGMPIGAPIPDTTPPAPGTLTVTPSDVSAGGTVTGASDAGRGLHASPYSFRLGAGAWTPFQTSPSYSWTGLTPTTAYTFQHRVRDAADTPNIAEGAAVNASTTATPADTTPPTWSATLTPGTPTVNSVVIAASALATDNVAVTGYQRSLDGGTTWAAITPSGLNFTLTGLAAATVYSSAKLRAKDLAGNYSTPLNVPSFTTAAPVGLAGAIMALSPAGYWKMDETSGTTAADSSGNSRNGTYAGTYTLNGSAGVKIETTGYVTIPSHADFSIGAAGISVIALIKPDNVSIGPVVRKALPGSFEWSADMSYVAGGTGAAAATMNVWKANGDDTKASVSTSTPAVFSYPAKPWAIVVWVVPDSKTPSTVLYGNGASLTPTFKPGSAVDTTPGPQPVIIGQKHNGTSTIASFRHVAIIKGVVTPEQVTALYSAANAEGLIG